MHSYHPEDKEDLEGQSFEASRASACVDAVIWSDFQQLVSKFSAKERGMSLTFVNATSDGRMMKGDYLDWSKAPPDSRARENILTDFQIADSAAQVSQVSGNLILFEAEGLITAYIGKDGELLAGVFRPDRGQYQASPDLNLPAPDPEGCSPVLLKVRVEQLMSEMIFTATQGSNLFSLDKF